MFDARSTFQQVFSESFTSLGTVAELQLPRESVIHKVAFHAKPTNAPTTFVVEMAMEFLLNGSLVSRLPANISLNAPTLMVSLFPFTTNNLSYGANCVAITYPSEASSFVLFPRSVICRADSVSLKILNRIGATGIKYYWSIHSASLPF